MNNYKITKLKKAFGHGVIYAMKVEDKARDIH